MTNKLLFVNIINPDDICIESLSFSTCGQYLAASYSNKVAILEVRTNFLITTLCDTCPDASFRTILWIPSKKSENAALSDYRLFTVGLHGIITEWDLNLCKAKSSCMSYGGAIFSGAFSSNTDLLVACDDGSVRSFSIWDNHKSADREPELNFKKVQVRHNKRVLSICCVPDGRFFCGTYDSLILICDVGKENYFSVIRVSSKRKPKRIQKESEEEETVPEAENTHIWCLEYIGKHNALASGDSNGNVILWDLSTLTMLQTFTQHNRDVLSLALLNQDTLFSAGLDSKVTMYTNNANNSQYLNDPELYLNTGIKDIESYLRNRSKEGWSVNGFKYPLKGDIRTMCISPSQGYTATGGNFGCISMCKGAKFMSNRKSKYKLMYPNLSPFNPTVSMNERKNMALCRYDYHCDLWYLPGNESENQGDLETISGMEESERIKIKDIIESRNPYKLCKIKTKENRGKINLCCLSPEGDSVAIANQQGLRIFTWDLNDLKITQKHEDCEINVLALAFWSNTELIVNHFKDKYLVSLYDLDKGRISDLNYLDFNKHVIKVTLHTKGLQESTDCDKGEGSNQEEKGQVEGKGNEPKNQEKGGKRENCPEWGVFYTLEGAVYVANFRKRSYLELPRLEGGSRVCTVSFSSDHEWLVAFSTSFKYYFYDLARGRMMEYEGRLVHAVENKRVNLNSVIANCFWQGNKIIVHTTYSIFYFKLLSPPFQNTRSFEIGAQDTLYLRADTPLKNKNALPQYNTAEERLPNGIPGKGGRFAERKERVVLGPRRLYQVPSIENLSYHQLLKNPAEPGYSQPIRRESSEIMEEAETPKSRGSNPSLETPRGNQSNTSFESGASNEFNSCDETPKLTESNTALELEELTRSPKFMYSEDSEGSPLPRKMSQTTDKGITNHTTILKSKFILHCDFLVRDSSVDIIAFRTPSREDVARKKTYGN